VGHLCLSSLSPSKQVPHSFKEDIAPKNAILQSSKKKAIGSTYERSAKASIASSNQSTGVTTRRLTKVAASITPKQQVMALTL